MRSAAYVKYTPVLVLIRLATLTATRLASATCAICDVECETIVVDGVPNHLDAVLSPAERESGKLMICVFGCNGWYIVPDC